MTMPIVYHWRSLFVRKTTTVLTVLVVAAVVGVFTWMFGFAQALSGSLAAAGDAQKIIVVKRGATSETNSALRADEAAKVNQVPGLAVDPATREPLTSPEMMVQISLPRLRDGGRTSANVAVRGVTEKAFQVHANVQTGGRVLGAGEAEVLVGAAAAKQFAGLEIGQMLPLGAGGNRKYRIAGYFSAGGGPMESEIWAYLPSLMNAYNRQMYSSVQLRVGDASAAGPAIEQIKGPSIQMEAMTEAEYWESQSSNIRTYLQVAYGLIAMMCLAAVFSIANTMFSMVAGRTREIAMLRTIGFTGRQILVGFLIEAVFLALLGGVLGCVACELWLATVGSTKDMFGANTFTTMAFQIRLTPWIVGGALLGVVGVGMLGAFVPAWRAKRVHVVSALRQA